MKVFEFDSIPESYPELLKYVLENGEEVSPRGMLTKEVTPATVVIHNPRKRLITSPERKLNQGFTVGELLWILQGKNDLSVTHYNKQWNNFTDDGEILNGAYGQRIFNWDGGDSLFEVHPDQENSDVQYEMKRVYVNQFAEVLNKLKSDKDSRQGTISMFDPVKDFLPTKDVPCTNLMRFSIRNNKLNMMVVMRSNDLWFGYPYDVFNFTMLQEIMAGLLGVDVGKYTHVADSLHLYEMHFESAKNVINAKNEIVYDNLPLMDARVDDSFSFDDVFNVEHLTRETGDIISVEEVMKNLDLISNDYWKSLAAVIATYNLKKSKREEEEINAIRSYITNEFKGLV